MYVRLVEFMCSLPISGGYIYLDLLAGKAVVTVGDSGLYRSVGMTPFQC